MVKIEDIKRLRKQTGVGISMAKKALEEAKGDLQKAIDFLRKKGAEIAAKKAEREAAEGIIETYVHPDFKLGVMLELNCETDFVSKNKDFKTLAHELALHIAANNPQVINPEEMKQSEIDKEIDIIKAQLKKEKKPENIIDKIITGKINKIKEESALLTQPFLMNQEITVKQRIEEVIAKVGENIKVNRFVRYKI